ncbi:hypothetical protein GOP47_0008169 [Adiantum capillus-veneris]|uniref:Uncharacterized protein n=1 Tax=Adiantum capillus-veneris TaxID=13818 RepID=A0A9D4ZHX6_ADICA|nr:hypothetical protein GOP47_0008169 [Adiantum capillus-veneris]
MIRLSKGEAPRRSTWPQGQSIIHKVKQFMNFPLCLKFNWHLLSPTEKALEFDLWRHAIHPLAPASDLRCSCRLGSFSILVRSKQLVSSQLVNIQPWNIFLPQRQQFIAIVHLLQWLQGHQKMTT